MPSTAVIRPATMVKAISPAGLPRSATSTPAAPLTTTGRNSACGCAPPSTARATSSAPRSRADPATKPSVRSTTSGSSSSTSLARSPARAAAKKASITAPGAVSVPSGSCVPAILTRCRARLASCLDASWVRPSIGAISPNGTSNTSCSTKATRSAGVSVSSTTSIASPTESASSASCSGVGPSAGLSTGSGTHGPARLSGLAALARSAFRQTLVTIVVSQPPRFSTPPAPAAANLTHASCTASSASSSDPSIR